MSTHITSILPKKQTHEHLSAIDTPPQYCALCRCFSIRNRAIDDCAEAISRANLVVCPTEKCIEEIIYPEIVAVAMGFNLPNGWSEEKQRVVEIHTNDSAKALLALLHNETKGR